MTINTINGLKQSDLPFNGMYIFDWYDEARAGLVFSLPSRTAFWFSHIATVDSEDDWVHIFLLCEVQYDAFEQLQIVDRTTQSPVECTELHTQVLLALLKNDLWSANGYLTMSHNIDAELGEPVAFSEMTPIERTLYQSKLHQNIAYFKFKLKDCLEKAK